MKDIIKRCSSAFVMQIMLIHIHFTSPVNSLPRRFLQDHSNHILDQKWKVIGHRDAKYEHPFHQINANQELFLRNEKSRNQASMLPIDLSGLSKAGASRIKEIDISVLSRNPDPTLPIAQAPHGNKKIMLLDQIDTSYDRLPIVKPQVVRNHPVLSYTERKNGPIFPFIHLPFKVVTSYHSISTDKKHDGNFKAKSNHLTKMENEQIYAANFILRLLYQMSNNYYGEHLF
ncbi:uncharacterized protein LOC118188012 [Stegodyphus dumicola]|uniref:uncharacterized protein LOC118188012 n=1 Tax=Stegodyphus dumicola TaxID=202533 RepID=UPI0015AF7313|nr:uncharacterized protein LOC118188012 [Stegodyphus dumicola]